MKIVINSDYGGFGLSNQAFELFMNKKGIEFDRVECKRSYRIGEFDYYRKGHLGDDDHYLWYFDLCDDRSDPALVAVVEELGEEANGWASSLKVVEIPDDVDWEIIEHDGCEHVAEHHRKWY